jgi:hypothetical protein
MNVALLETADHVGRHPEYSKAMLKQLAQVPGNLSPGQTAAEVQNIVNIAMDAIRKGTWGPWH